MRQQEPSCCCLLLSWFGMWLKPKHLLYTLWIRVQFNRWGGEFLHLLYPSKLIKSLLVFRGGLWNSPLTISGKVSEKLFICVLKLSSPTISINLGDKFQTLSTYKFSLGEKYTRTKRIIRNCLGLSWEKRAPAVGKSTRRDVRNSTLSGGKYARSASK